MTIPLFLASLACGKREQQSDNRAQQQAPQAVDSEAPPASTIAMSDPQHASQLIRGFYGIEQSWRWTQKNFSVSLAAPAGSAQKGALLHFRFAVPEPVIQNLKSVTLSATVNGFSLKPEIYDKSGQYTYTRQVPAEQMRTNNVSVDFTLNRALPPGGVEKRELGIVASEVGLTANE